MHPIQQDNENLFPHTYLSHKAIRIEASYLHPDNNNPVPFFPTRYRPTATYCTLTKFPTLLTKDDVYSNRQKARFFGLSARIFFLLLIFLLFFCPSLICNLIITHIYCIYQVFYLLLFLHSAVYAGETSLEEVRSQ